MKKGLLYPNAGDSVTWFEKVGLLTEATRAALGTAGSHSAGCSEAAPLQMGAQVRPADWPWFCPSPSVAGFQTSAGLPLTEGRAGGTNFSIK